MSDFSDNILEFTTARTDEGKRADVLVAQYSEITRSAASSLLEKGMVTVNGGAVKKNYKAETGDVFSVELPEPQLCDVLPEDIHLDVVYEDEDVIIINKPQGMVVHPAPGHTTGTLVSALMYRCGDTLSDINGVIRPGIVHRIDRDTSGLIAVAKNNAAHLSLAAQLEDHSMARVYYAVVLGRTEKEGTVDAAISRHPTDRKKMAVAKYGGKRAVTHYETVEEFEGFSLIKVRLETGRTHQIRVHMAHIGHPVIYDPVYGRPSLFEKKHPHLMDGQCLHAGELTFTHPKSGERVNVTCPLPDNFQRVLELLRK